MQLNNLNLAIEEICKEKNLSKERVLEAIEQALAAAYRKDFGQKNQNIKVEFDLKTGKIEVFDVKRVVEDVPEELSVDESKQNKKKKKRNLAIEDLPASRSNSVADDGVSTEKKFDPKKEIFLSEAKKIKKDVKIGDEIKTKLEVPASFGRVAAQTAKQVITQRLREAEKEILYQKYKKREGEIVSGVVQRSERGNVYLDLEGATALLPFLDQIGRKKYAAGQKIKVCILEVKESPRGVEIIVSHSHPKILRELFRTEIPEIANDIVEIKAVAREAGQRAKIAVMSKEKGVDPIGACIGQRGTRIQTIIAELEGEKIDIIEYTDNPINFVINALAPAKISSAKISDEKNKIISVKAKSDQLSLAIGREGQNVRLAARLTGWKIEIEEEKKV